MAKAFLRGVTTGAGWPPDWASVAYSFVWPVSFFQYCFGSGKILAVPTIVFLVGSWLLKKRSGFVNFEPRVHGKMLHLRWKGYDSVLAEKQIKYLRESGRKAYFKMLRLDLAFPLFYGTALIWALHRSKLMETYPSWSLMIYAPVVAVIADWVENTILLSQLPKCSIDGSDLDAPQLTSPLNKTLIQIASVATTIKIVSFILSIAILIAIAAIQ